MLHGCLSLEQEPALAGIIPPMDAMLAAAAGDREVDQSAGVYDSCHVHAQNN